MEKEREQEKVEETEVVEKEVEVEEMEVVEGGKEGISHRFLRVEGLEDHVVEVVLHQLLHLGGCKEVREKVVKEKKESEEE